MWSFIESFGEVTNMCEPNYYDLTILIDAKSIELHT